MHNKPSSKAGHAMIYKTQDIKSPLPIHQTLEMVGNIIIGTNEVKATLNLNNYNSYLNITNNHNILLEINEPILFTNTDRSWMIKASYFGDKKKIPVNSAIHSNKILETFFGIQVNFSGIKTWLKVAKLNTQITIKEKLYSFKTKSITIDNADDIAIEIKPIKNSIDIEEAKNIIFHMKMFFSLLIGSLVSVDYIWVIDSNELPIPAFLLIHQNKTKTNPYVNDIFSLVSFNQIDNFQSILQNYFSIKPISSVSSYIVAFFDYEGYWQLELMQYLFLVEGYGKEILKNCKSNENKKITETKSKKDDSETIDLFLKDNPKTPEKIKKILNKHKDSVSQFEKRVEFLFEDFTSDEVLKKILKLNKKYHLPNSKNGEKEDFFKVLNKYRNIYAHHDIDQLENIDPKHAYPFKCLLRLLLVFRLYSHMGLNIEKIFEGYCPDSLISKNLVSTKFVGGDFYVCLDPTEIARHSQRSY